MESLLSLSLFLFLILASLEFFGFARKSFFRLKDLEETREAVLSALDKSKIDIIHAGLGLLEPIRLGVLKGVEATSNYLRMQSRDKNFNLLSELFPGQTNIYLGSTAGLTKGREICILDQNKGEVKRISSLTQKSILISSPLQYHFFKEGTELFSLKKISLFYDQKNQTIRRQVNNSPAQPLLEDVISFDFHYEEAMNLIWVRLCLKSNKEKEYESSVFTKNIALALIDRQL